MALTSVRVSSSKGGFFFQLFHFFFGSDCFWGRADEWMCFAELRDAGGFFFQDAENNLVWLDQQGEKREKPAVVQIAIRRQSKRRNAII